MPFAEVIFEDGSHSIVAYADEEEIKSFLTEHHQRAIDGTPGAAQDQVERTDIDPADFTNLPPLEFMKSRPASRIYKVYTYDVHPGDLTPTTVDAKTMKSLIDGMADKSGQVNPDQLTGAIRDEASAVYPQDQGARESQYKAEASGELPLDFLPTTESGS